MQLRGLHGAARFLLFFITLLGRSKSVIFFVPIPSVRGDIKEFECSMPSSASFPMIWQ
jgi:hypothetical protein